MKERERRRQIDNEVEKTKTDKTGRLRQSGDKSQTEKVAKLMGRR